MIYLIFVFTFISEEKQFLLSFATSQPLTEAHFYRDNSVSMFFCAIGLGMFLFSASKDCH